MRRVKLLFPLGILSFLFLLSCSGRPGPEQIAGDFLQALEYGDLDKARSLSVPETHGALKWYSTRETEKLGGEGAFSVLEGQCQLDGQYARVPYYNKVSEDTLRLTLRQDGKDWKVLARRDELPGGKRSPGEVLKDHVWEKGEDLKEDLGNAFEKLLEGLGKAVDTLGEMLEEEFEAPEAPERDMMERVLSPEKVAQRFFDALEKGDLEEAYKFSTTMTRRLIKMRWDMMDSARPKEFEGPFEILRSEEIDENELRLYYKQAGEEKSLTMHKDAERGWEVGLSKTYSDFEIEDKEEDRKFSM